MASTRSACPAITFLFSLALFSCGGGGGTPSMAPAPPTATIELLAGASAPASALDGPAATATFGEIWGIALNPVTGQVIVADGAIRSLDPDNVVRTIAGSHSVLGSRDGPVAVATFAGPRGIAFDATGNLYIADSGNHKIRKLSTGGIVTTLAGDGQLGHRDGPATSARFNYPAAVALDAAGNVYVADGSNHVIRRISPEGAVSTIAGSAGNPGDADGVAASARFSMPAGIGFDPTDGSIVIADTGNHTIRRLTPGGTVRTVAGQSRVMGFQHGAAGVATFVSPGGIAVDAAGNILVPDAGNAVRKIDPAGTVTIVAGNRDFGLRDGPAAQAQFWAPGAVALGPSGSILVADTFNHRIRAISASGVVSTLAGNDLVVSADGVGAAARFTRITAMAPDGVGNLLVLDNGSLRRVATTGAVTTVARFLGTSLGLSHGDNGNALVTRGLWCPGRLAPPGCRAGTQVLTISPTGQVTVFEEAGEVANPKFLTRDAGGNLYRTDSLFDAVLRSAPGGNATVFAGGPAGFVDGAVGEARFSNPGGLAVDSANNLYVADLGNGALRKISPAGSVTTVARFPASDMRFNVTPLTIDSTNNVYLADTTLHVVRKISPSGAITTIAGREDTEGFAIGPLPGLLRSPRGVVSIGNALYIATENAILVIRNPA